jgi:PAS domain S-box-containing protein
MIRDFIDPADSPNREATIPVSTILSEGQLSELFDGIKDLIQSIAPDGHFLFVNRAWREALGYSVEEVATLNIFNIIHPDCRAHCQKFMERIMAGEHVGLIEVPFQTKDGQVIVVEGNVSLYV